MSEYVAGGLALAVPSPPPRGWDRIPGGGCQPGPSLGRGLTLDSGLSVCVLSIQPSEKALVREAPSSAPGWRGSRLLWSAVGEGDWTLLLRHMGYRPFYPP